MNEKGDYLKKAIKMHKIIFICSILIILSFVITIITYIVVNLRYKEKILDYYESKLFSNNLIVLDFNMNDYIENVDDVLINIKELNIVSNLNIGVFPDQTFIEFEEESYIYEYDEYIANKNFFDYKNGLIPDNVKNLFLEKEYNKDDVLPIMVLENSKYDVGEILEFKSKVGLLKGEVVLKVENNGVIPFIDNKYNDSYQALKKAELFIMPELSNIFLRNGYNSNSQYCYIAYDNVISSDSKLYEAFFEEISKLGDINSDQTLYSTGDQYLHETWFSYKYEESLKMLKKLMYFEIGFIVFLLLYFILEERKIIYEE